MSWQRVNMIAIGRDMSRESTFDLFLYPKGVRRPRQQLYTPTPRTMYVKTAVCVAVTPPADNVTQDGLEIAFSLRMHLCTMSECDPGDSRNGLGWDLHEELQVLTTFRNRT